MTLIEAAAIPPQPFGVTSMKAKRHPVPCFDCGEVTGSPSQVYRNEDHSKVDWSRGLPDGARVVFVHRAGTGCHKGETDSDIR
jgi:hypothetical protein